MTTTVPDARWDCRQCSLCCRMLALGPVRPERIERMEAVGVGKLVDGPWLRLDARGAWLEQRDGACVFLRRDGLCAVHVEHGAEEKPVFCRTFPFHVVHHEGGRSVSLREDCGGLAHGETPLADQLADVPEDAYTHSFQGPVQALPGVGVSAEDWLHLEPRLLAVIEDRPWRENVRALRGELFRALRREPPEPDAATARAAAAAVAGGLAQMLGGRARGAGWVEDFLTRVEDDLAGGEATPDDAYLAGVLRQQLVGKRVARHGGAPGWLGVYALLAELAERSPSPTAAAHVRLSRLALHPLFAELERRARQPIVALFLST